MRISLVSLSTNTNGTTLPTFHSSPGHKRRKVTSVAVTADTGEDKSGHRARQDKVAKLFCSPAVHVPHCLQPLAAALQ